MRLEERHIVLDHLEGVRLHLRDRHPWVDTDVVERAIQALDMLPQLIGAMPERAGGIEHPISHTKATIKHRHSGLTGRYQTSVDIHDGLTHALSLLLVRYG